MNPKILLAVAAIFILGAAGLLFTNLRPADGAPTVVVYTSVDEEFAKPLFESFTKASGIQVVSRFDSEETKTTGLATRLEQMKDHPDGDVFWNSELSLTQRLKTKGVFEPYESPNAKSIPAKFKDRESIWAGFGCRARVIIYNTNRVKRDELPRTLDDLADSKWKGRFAVAKPLFGTTLSHLVSLYQALGEEKALKLFRAWRENGVTLVDGNSDVRERVAEGLFDIGLTDSDDAFSAMDHKKPVNFVVIDQSASWHGSYLVPNTVAILKNCQHTKEARTFVDFLLRPETEKWLAEQGARQIPVRDVGAKLPPPLNEIKLEPVQIDVEKLGEQVMPIGARINDILSGKEK